MRKGKLDNENNLIFLIGENLIMIYSSAVDYCVVKTIIQHRQQFPVSVRKDCQVPRFFLFLLWVEVVLGSFLLSPLRDFVRIGHVLHSMPNCCFCHNYWIGLGFIPFNANMQIPIARNHDTTKKNYENKNDLLTHSHQLLPSFTAAAFSPHSLPITLNGQKRGKTQNRNEKSSSVIAS